MTILLDGSGSFFEILRQIIDAFVALNMSQGSTIPGAIDDILAEAADSATVAGMSRSSRLSTAVQQFQRQLTVQNELGTFARQLLIDRVIADDPSVPSILDKCITELIRQMDDSSDTVERNVVSVAVTNPSSSPTLIATDTGGDGITLQRMVPETIVGRYVSGSSIVLESGNKEPNTLSFAWPAGSGIRTVLSVESTGLLSNQSFDYDTIEENSPDNWIVTVGQIGTTVALTVTEVQKITITGGPTSGFWRITFTRTDGIVQMTEQLTHDASAADVESALAALEGMPTVSVTVDGELPDDVEYTIEFNAVSPPGNQSALSTSENFDAGSISVSELTAGTASYEWRAMTWLGDGAELTAIQQPIQGLSLSPSTCYAFSIQAKTGAAATGGTLVCELVDGTGTVITDDVGTNNRITTALSGLSHTEFAPITGVFRTPASLPTVFYLQLRLSVAIPVTKVLYLDDCLLIRMAQLYQGGPLVALAANDQLVQPTDRYEIDVANNFAGELQTYFSRIFGRQLPSATSGAETIPD